MKVLVIGDIHGLTDWEMIVKTNTFDKVVFIGDYFDSFTILPMDQIDNFKNILEYKRNNFDKTILLIGNHDYHYMNDIKNSYSGFNASACFQYLHLIESALKENLLTMAHKVDDYLFTHAGVTKTWCLNNNINPDHTNIDDEINMLFQYQRRKFDIQMPGAGYGDEIYQSPIWVRPDSLSKDATDHIHVIGHTHKESIEFTDAYINTDTLPHEYVCIDTGTKVINISKLI